MSGVKGMRWGHLEPCPSWSAYKHHLRSREVPCEPCRQFVRDARRARRLALAAEAALARRQERDIRAVVAILAGALADSRRAA